MHGFFRSAWMAVSLLALATSALAFDEGTGELAGYCDPGVVLSKEERDSLLEKMQSTQTGRAVLADFVREYGSFENLLIQWDGVSYSQVVTMRPRPARGLASGTRPHGVSRLGNAVCVHLTRKLPPLEHVADLSHELAHATRLEKKVLLGEVSDVEEFVKARLAARGGEADAFAVECRVKREMLGRWDSFCLPYADVQTNRFDTARVIKDFYNGRLSASLTGETYPVMLSRQYKAMLAKKALQSSRDAAASRPISALENKPGIQ